MDFFDLRMRLGGFPVGAWFQIDSGWSSKRFPRPHVLVEPFTGHEIAHVCPRTTKGGYGFDHEPHPEGHADRCCVNEPGTIVLDRLPIESGILPGGYTCDEPDGA